MMEGIVSDAGDVMVRAGTSFGESIERMDQLKKGIALIVDGKNRLLGIVTDGDIRRAILQGITPDEGVQKAMNPKPFCLNPGFADGEMVRIMTDRDIYHLPIVDEDGRVRGIVLKKTFAQQKIISCPVVIMAGGKGTRLLPLTEDVPKPLLPVSGKPIIAHIVEQFRDEGAKDFYVCVNYKKKMIEDFLGDGKNWRVKVSYVRETESLGTAGSLSLLPEMSTPFFVTNADVLASINLKAMFRFHCDNQSALTMAIKKIHFAVPYGTVTLKHNSIVALSEKPSVENFVNAGIYIIDNRWVKEIPTNGRYEMTDFALSLLARKRKIAGYLIDDNWTDIGQIKDYFIANGVNPHDISTLAGREASAR